MINFGASRDSISTTDQYLRTFDGAPTNLNGYALPWDATLVALSASGQVNTQTYTLEVRKNGVATVESSITMTNQFSNYDDTIDVDFNAGDRVQFYCNGTGIDRPLIEAYFRRRL